MEIVIRSGLWRLRDNVVLFWLPDGITAASMSVIQSYSNANHIWSAVPLGNTRFPIVWLGSLNTACIFIFDIWTVNIYHSLIWVTLPGRTALPKLHEILDVVKKRTLLSYLPCNHVYFHAEQIHYGTDTCSFPLCWHTHVGTRHYP